jgi:two-component system response regulator
MPGGTVLLVEDRPDDIVLIMRALKRGHEDVDVVVARNGAEALYLLGLDGQEEPARLPAVVMLDLQRATIDGAAIVRRLRADRRTRFVPVVALASEESRSTVLPYELGANSFVRKPTALGELEAAMRMISAYWLLLNESPHQQSAAE